jgi:hypothetical protein
MQKMRHAGFDMLFIGVESFDSNSLLETAKVQNTSPESLERSIRTIQSYGFMVVGGLIFGFDSDTTDSFERTLNGLMESGMLSGDPSLLTALPGTPLYHRMRLAGRLRDVRYGLGGYKYQTNIKYLMSRDQMIAGYKSFVKKFSSGRYQFGRLEKFLTNLKTNNNFIPLNRSGYGNLNVFIKIVFKNPAALWQLFRRFALFSARPERLFWLVKGILLVLRSPMRAHLFGYLQFWFFAWSNAVLKYSKLSSKDFDIEGLNRKPLPNEILPDGYENYDYEEIPHQKSEAQRRSTTKQLLNVISSTEKEKS